MLFICSTVGGLGIFTVFIRLPIPDLIFLASATPLIAPTAPPIPAPNPPPSLLPIPAPSPPPTPPPIAPVTPPETAPPIVPPIAPPVAPLKDPPTPPPIADDALFTTPLTAEVALFAKPVNLSTVLPAILPGLKCCGEKFGADIFGIPTDGTGGTLGKGGIFGVLIPDTLGKLGVDTLGTDGTLGILGTDGIAGVGILGTDGIDGVGILLATSAFLATANFNPLDASVGGPGNAGSISLNDLSSVYFFFFFTTDTIY